MPTNEVWIVTELSEEGGEVFTRIVSVHATKEGGNTKRTKLSNEAQDPDRPVSYEVDSWKVGR